MKKINENIPEITLLTGLFFIICGCFLLGFIVGIFSIGVVLSGMGIFLAKRPLKK